MKAPSHLSSPIAVRHVSRVLFLFFWFLTGSLSAALVRSIDDTDVENSYYLLASDETDGDTTTNFHGFDTSFEITVENTEAGDSSHFRIYRVAYQLMRDNEGSPVAVTLEGGGTTAFTNSQFANLAAGINSSTFSLAALPIPQDSLSDKEQYFVKGQLQSRPLSFVNPPPPYTNVVGATDQSSASIVFEFTNTNSLDIAYNIEAIPYQFEWTKTHALASDSADNGFGVGMAVAAYRYDAFTFPVGNVTASVTVDFDLLRASDMSEVPLQDDGVFTQTASAPSYNDSGARPIPTFFGTSFFGFVFDEQIVPTVQLDSVNETYIVRATVSHIENALGSVETGATCELDPERLLHFNGNLQAGPETVMVNEFANEPTLLTNNAPTDIETAIEVPTNGGSISTRPDLAFGNESNLNVDLLPNGDMILTNGAEQPYPADGSGDPVRCLAGPDVSYSSVFITTIGYRASGFTYFLPQGLVYFSNHNQNPYLGISRLNQSTPFFDLDSTLCPVAPLSISTATATAPALGDEAHPIIFPIEKSTQAFVIETDGVLKATTSATDLPEYVHRDDLELLETFQKNGLLDDAAMAQRCSNDQYLREIDDVSARLLWTADNDGTARLNEGNLKVLASTFNSHFPKKSKIPFQSDSQLVFQNGSISTKEGSLLGNVPALTVPYYQTCPGPIAEGCTDGLSTVDVTQEPDGSELFFAASGGLWAQGDIVNNGKLAWGRKSPDPDDFTHFTSNFNRGNFYMPGYNLYASENDLFNNPVYKIHASDLAPTALLLGGFDGDFSNSQLHVFGEEGYRKGDGSLPGLTFEVDAPGAEGGSRLASNTSTYAYELLEDQGNGGSKYYIREAGVSGRQIGRDGTYDPELDLYGFACEIKQFQLSFLDNTNEADGCESWVDGVVAVSGYSNWDQDFTGLRFDCLGQPGEMEVNLADADDKSLSYWNSSFDLKSLAFINYEEPDGQCPPQFEGKLAAGAKTRANYIADDLFGTLVFCNNGNLSTLQDALDEPEAFDGVDSQLRIPSVIPLEGPNQDYNLVTTSKLRFNNPEAPGLGGAQPPSGFVTFAATIDIPYFRDLEVQAITTATTDDGPSTAPFAITPGWDDSDGDTFFSKVSFDSTHSGFPFGELSYEAYRDPANSGINVDTLISNDHLVVAEQDMFGFIPLRYPLYWSDSTRRFASARTEMENIFVAQMEHKVDWMDAKFTNISFGATYDGLPEIGISNFLNGEIDKASEVISNKLGEVPKQAIDKGLDKLDEMLEDALCSIINPVVDSAAGTQMNPGPIRDLYRFIYQVYQNNPTDDYLTFRTKVEDALNNPAAFAFNSIPELAALRDHICTISETGNATIAESSSFLNQIEEALEDIIKGIDVITQGIDDTQDYSADISVPTIDPSDIQGILYRNGSDELEIVNALIDLLLVNLVEPAVRDIVQPLLESATSELNEQLNMLLEDIDPALRQISEVLMTVRGFLAEVHGKVADAGEVVDQFQDFFPANAADKNTLLNSFISPVTTRAWNFFLQVEASAGIDVTVDGARQFNEFAENFFNSFTEDQFVQLIKDELKDVILESEFVRKTQYLLRQLLYDVADRVTSSLQSVLAEITNVMKTVISDTVGALEDKINPLLGEVSNYMGSGEISGYAEFNGDSLRKLRLDAEMQFEIPEEMQLHVYLEILAYTSEDNFVDSGCIKPGEKMVEVRIGAKDVSVEWISECKINLEVKLSLKDFDTSDPVPPIPVGVGGTFELSDGEIDFQTFKILEFGATIAIGIDECYLGAKARAIFSDYEVAAGIFFGRTCTLEPLIFVDPDIADVIDAGTTFTGAYVYGEVWLPISQLVLGVPPSCLFRIDAGVGAGAFYFLEGPTYGGKIFLGVSGEALCVVSIKGEIKIILASQAGKLKGAGNGKFSAKVGWCPFCIKFSKSVKLLYNDGSWSIQ
jgi:hypothetical protein